MAIADRGALTFVQQADGALSNKNMERFALLIADGVELPDAWRAIGKRNEGGSQAYRRRVEEYPPFKARLAQLRAEKEELMADDMFGEMKWMANQLWREARARGDHAAAVKAAELRWKVIEKECAFKERENPAPATRPGRPSVENPQTISPLNDLKAKLIEAGVPAPGISPPVRKDVAEEIQAPHEVSEPQYDLETMLSRAVPG